MELRLPLEWFMGWQATCRAVSGTFGFSGRCPGVSVPLRVVSSSTGLHSKRCPGIGFLSRGDWEIGVFWNVAATTRLRFKFLLKTGLILRCDGKVGNQFQTKLGNRPSCRDQEGRRGLEEVVPGTSVFLSSETGMLGKFLGRIKGFKYRFELQDGTWAFS